jgi:hypothetical protein
MRKLCPFKVARFITSQDFNKGVEKYMILGRRSVNPFKTMMWLVNPWLICAIFWLKLQVNYIFSYLIHFHQLFKTFKNFKIMYTKKHPKKLTNYEKRILNYFELDWNFISTLQRSFVKITLYSLTLKFRVAFGGQLVV